MPKWQEGMCVQKKQGSLGEKGEEEYFYLEA